jgi:hypothetical protein
MAVLRSCWAPGTTGPLGTCLSEDVELRQLMEGVAGAGSWAVWMGVFSKSWMKLLVAGGLTFKRARIVTGKISAIITECRCHALSPKRPEKIAFELSNSRSFFSGLFGERA